MGGYPYAPVAGNDIARAFGYIKAHPDYTSYHLLFMLRREAPSAYGDIPPDTRAGILTSALASQQALNDWSMIHPDGEGTSVDFTAAQALLELKRAALPHLLPLLDDTTHVEIAGSSARMESLHYQYRRCDFAYRYCALILGEHPVFEEYVEERQRLIDDLKTRLTKQFEEPRRPP